MHRSIGIIAAMAVATASPAVARWHGTDWGMSREKVTAAIGVPMTESKSGLVAPVTVAGIAFTGYFLFDAKGLNGVTLEIVKASDCDTVAGMLERHFGLRSAWRDKPNEVFPSQLWEDTAQGNFVDFGGHRTVDGTFDGCAVNYSPIPREPVAGW